MPRPISVMPLDANFLELHFYPGRWIGRFSEVRRPCRQRAGRGTSALAFYENWGVVTSKPYEGTGQEPYFRTMCEGPVRAILEAQDQLPPEEG
jgi:hypothetical protein